MSRSRRKWLGAVVFAAVAAIAVGVVTADSSDTPCGELSLTSAEWSPTNARTAKDGSSSARQQIADDIIRCDALRTNTKAEVLAKVGRPNGSKAAKTWEWVIGKDRRSGGFPGFPEVMTIEFDDGERVQRVSTSTR